MTTQMMVPLNGVVFTERVHIHDLMSGNFLKAPRSRVVYTKLIKLILKLKGLTSEQLLFPVFVW